MFRVSVAKRAMGGPHTLPCLTQQDAGMVPVWHRRICEGTHMSEIRAFMFRAIDEALQRRNWNTLPQDYTYAAVRKVFHIIKPHFDKRDIKARIDASRAQSFIDLRRAVEHMNYL